MSKSRRTISRPVRGSVPQGGGNKQQTKKHMTKLRGLWARLFVWTTLLGVGVLGAQAQITNNPATDITSAVSSGVTIFNSVYAIVIAAVVLGFLLWVLSAVRRRR